ncbi:hypothetical protein BCR37DRAFT_378157 [Protomyces lactucae-debilis]|uniref:VLRF1 domain-containing protein n=1 Tax=Protomyces lactucae-debilis TaxID=2754530 RepID=A0A1Y2FMA9_PROLT|nr:uncharacterized protein BCR37DRAFT_378157 [Protomyces lactucae-debilis]ORY85100.1 hypothetical protein BCR37DRAFT_378157 [Protomyces lactucae-debilis]
MTPSSQAIEKPIYIYDIPQELLKTLKPLTQSHISQIHADEHYDDAALTDSDEEEDLSAVLQVKASLVDDAPVQPTKGSPITWATSSIVPPPTKLGIYSTMLPSADSSIASIQMSNTSKPRSIAMFMVGGGHFAGAIISLNGSTVAKCSIKATKGFHRYTTRRKQGGAQSANDNAKGAANSAGAQIRRYNEIALKEDIAGLFQEWKAMLEDVELILIRASGAASRKLLHDAGLAKQDPRVRGFPINTRRATQAEIIRSFHILTRLQLGSVLDDKEEVKPRAAPAPLPKVVEEIPDKRLVGLTERLLPLIKRNKIPAIKQILQEESMDATKFLLEPKKSFAHTPTLLHYAASAGADAVVKLLLDLGADPTRTNAEQQTPFEVSSGKGTRDAFRLWRGAGHEATCDWDAARVPAALTFEQVKARQAREAEERSEQEAIEATRREQELERIKKESEAAEAQRQAAEGKRRGPGRSLALGVLGQSTSADLNNLTPEMKKKVERERRARAAEARFGKK